MTKNDSQKIKERVPYGIPSVEHYDIISTGPNPEKIEALIDRRLARLKKCGVDIGQCADYLESMVEEYIAKLESELEYKHRANKRFLSRAFLRRSSDKKDFGQLQRELEEEITKTKQEIDLVKLLYEKCNPLYKGRVKLPSIGIGAEFADVDESEDEDTDE